MIIKNTRIRITWTLHLMLLLPILILIVFNYIPMIGIVVAFQDYLPTRGFFGSDWVGFEHFRFLFSLRETRNVISNTVIISVSKIFFGLSFSLLFSILLNEIPGKMSRRFVQSCVFFPYFLSWVILGGIFVDMFGLDGGINRIIGIFGFDSILFLGNNTTFVPTIVLTSIWKDFGYNMIIFYAAIMSIDSSLYEAATVDGANRFRQTISVTIPSLAPTIAVLGLLGLGNVLNAGFDQIFNMYNPLVYQSGDILDTYIFRIGLVSGQYAYATAIGLFKSLVGFVLILIAFISADKFANYRII